MLDGLPKNREGILKHFYKHFPYQTHHDGGQPENAKKNVVFKALCVKTDWIMIIFV